MRLLRVGEAGHEKIAVSIDGQRARVLDLGEDERAKATSVVSETTVSAARRVLAGEVPAVEVSLDEVRIGPPILPGKIVCIGLNYRRHAAEAGMAIPDEPILFLKAADTTGGPNDHVVVPVGSTKTDYEVELGVVIGRTARNLPSAADALDYVFGYLAANDVSERAFQLERGGQWDKGKNCETFSPLGPFLVTADDVPDPQALRLSSHVNGEQRQESTTADMIFPVSYLVWYVSQFMTLYPGDVILTGTPEGVGSGFHPPRFLSDGDVVEVAISGLGHQRHRFVGADSFDAGTRLSPMGATDE